jgi:ubiquitin C-terminal hydrolase
VQHSFKLSYAFSKFY